MKFNDYKYIVMTGCSYSQVSNAFADVRNFSAFINYTELAGISDKFESPYKDIIVIDVGLSSHGSDWQADSLIYTVDKLLSFGIEPENIYCYIEWSEWHRVSFNNNYFLKSNWDDVKFCKHTGTFGDVGILHINMEEGKQVYNSFADIREDNSGLSSRLRNKHSEVAWFIEDNILVRQSKLIPQLGMIGDIIYLAPNHTGDASPTWPIDLQMWFEESNKVQKQLSEDYKLKNYLDNILRTQWFLEAKNIRYNCTTIYSQFYGWSTKSGVKELLFRKNYQFDSKTFTLIKENLYDYSEDSSMENVWPEYVSLIKKIDFSNWWFHESKLFKKGGIDECAMEEWARGIYTSANMTASDGNKLKLSVNVQVPQFGHHPILPFYILLWNRVSTNCDFLKIKPTYLELISNLMKEDMESDRVTEHGVMISNRFLPILNHERLRTDDNVIVTINEKKYYETK